MNCEEVQPGCFQVDEASEEACGENEGCVEGSGCVCDANPTCDPLGPGEHCVGGAIQVCTADADGCLVAAEPQACPAPTVCEDDADGPNDAACVCPPVGTEEGTQCTTANVTTCSADGSDVIRCELTGEEPFQCLVWVSQDNCAADGLTCEQNDCVCPDNTQGDEFWANPVVDRSARPPEEIIPTGVREPAICAFEEMSTALRFAIAANAPNPTQFDTYAIASNDDGDLDPANDPVAIFDTEELPWPRIPDNVTATTEDDSFVEGSGVFNPANFVVVVNSHNLANVTDPLQNDDASVHVSGRHDRLVTSKGGAVKGLTFVRGPCRFNGSEDEDLGCNFPTIAMFLDGDSNTTQAATAKLPSHLGGGNFELVTDTAVTPPSRPGTQGNARVVDVVINGAAAGGLDLRFPPGFCAEDHPGTSGIFEGGSVIGTDPESPGSFLFVADDLSDDDCFPDGVFADVDRGDWLVIGTGPNQGTFFVEDILPHAAVFPLSDDTTARILELRGTGVDEEAVGGQWSVVTNETSGTRVDFTTGDEFFNDGSWRWGFVGNGNAIVSRLSVLNFASTDDVEDGRAGVVTLRNFNNNNNDDNLFFMGLLADFNDVGVVHENGRAMVSEYDGDRRSMVTNSRGFGILVEQGIFHGEHVTVTGTTFGDDTDSFDESGDGIRIANWHFSVTTWDDVISTDNSRHGAYVGNDRNGDTEQGDAGINEGDMYCYDDEGYDGETFYGGIGESGDLQAGIGGPCEGFTNGAIINKLPGELVEGGTPDGLVDFSGAQLSANNEDGLHITDFGEVIQNGGELSRNGDNGVQLSGFSVFNAGSRAVGDGTEPLTIADNGFEGLLAHRGEANLVDTVFTNNGTLDLCANDPQDEDDDLLDERAAAVYITTTDDPTVDRWDSGDDELDRQRPYATLHADNIQVITNNGAGVVINTDGFDNFETAAEEAEHEDKLPAHAEDEDRPNTIVGSLVDGNSGILADLGCDTEYTATSGVEVWNDAVLNYSGLTVTNNDKRGVLVDGGAFVRPSDVGNEDDADGVVVIESNGYTGLSVENDDTSWVVIVGGNITLNGHGDDDDGDKDDDDDGVEVRGGIVSLAETLIDQNNQDGVFVNTPADDDDVDPEYTPSKTRVRLTALDVRTNGNDGIRLISAPGSLGVVNTAADSDGDAYPGTLMDVDPRVHNSEYGVIIEEPEFIITNNMGDGLHVGAADMDVNVTVWIDRGDIFDNRGVGVRLEQHAGYVPDTSECTNDEGIDDDLDDDGTDGDDNSFNEKTTEFGCVGITQHGLKIHDNDLEGELIQGVYFVPRSDLDAEPAVHYGLGFSSNEIYHNSLEPGCGTTTSGGDDLPQVRAVGLVPQDPDLCSVFDSQDSCEESSFDGGQPVTVNNHCFWFETACLPVYDLRGTINACNQTTANPNQIHSYNTSDAAERSVGLYAETNARVWVDFNSFRTADFSRNVDQASGGNVILDEYCGGNFTICVSPEE